MIYAQLKTVPRWNMALTPLVFLFSSFTGGAMLANQMSTALLLLGVLFAVQIAYWMWGDGAFHRANHTIESATGLGAIGKTHQFEPPHTGDNYLLSEMVHQVGRKHALKLRVIAIIFMVVLPLAVLSLTTITHITAFIAIITHIIGLFCARWLFFAEAEHVVGLYYDKR